VIHTQSNSDRDPRSPSNCRLHSSAV
jgi:hypothetical protein